MDVCREHWTFVASTAGVIVGLSNDSLALVAFGVVGLLDVAGSVVLVVHFVHARRHGQLSERFEHFPLNAVTTALVGVGTAVGVASLVLLSAHQQGHETMSGIALAAVSLAILSMLSLRKRHLANRIPSHALLADSRLSAVGAILAAVTLAGTAATSSLGWWWADPVAALAIALAATALGFSMRRQAAREP